MSEHFARYERDARAALARLSARQRRLFALLVCRRHEPYYRVRSGDATLFDAVEQALLGGSADLEALRRRIDTAYPSDETDDDDTAWLALNGLDACSHALRLLEPGDRLDDLWALASFCYDAADREACLQLMPDGGAHTPEVEAAIARSAPVRRELAWQFEVFERLAAGEPPPMAFLDEKAAEPLLFPPCGSTSPPRSS